MSSASPAAATVSRRWPPSHGIHPIVADVTEQADVDALRDEIAALGPVNALVNNAGGAFGSATVEHERPRGLARDVRRERARHQAHDHGDAAAAARRGARRTASPTS